MKGILYKKSPSFFASWQVSIIIELNLLVEVRKIEGEAAVLLQQLE